MVSASRCAGGKSSLMRTALAVRKAPGKCHVAAAYFGQQASKLLPLKRGKELVLDFSEVAVQSAHVCPSEVLVLLKRGKEVHSVNHEGDGCQ